LIFVELVPDIEAVMIKIRKGTAKNTDPVAVKLNHDDVDDRQISISNANK